MQSIRSMTMPKNMKRISKMPSEVSDEDLENIIKLLKYAKNKPRFDFKKFPFTPTVISLLDELFILRKAIKGLHQQIKDQNFRK